MRLARWTTLGLHFILAGMGPSAAENILSSISTSALTLTLAFSFSSLASPTLTADPDHIASGLEFGGTTSIQIGDCLPYRNFRIGGMLAARNEERFTEIVLPNHNWRGIGCISYQRSLGDTTNPPWLLSVALKHESAHPTMGIEEPTRKACEMVYDGQYRRFILNSLSLRGRYCILKSRRTELKVAGQYNLLFLSKNTPELLNQDLGLGNGFSGGIEYAHPVLDSANLYISIFDRIILEGSRLASGAVFFGDDANLSLNTVDYPIINSVNTLAVEAGIALRPKSIKRSIRIFTRFVHGNIYGFVDSRDKRTRVSVGVEI